MKKGATPRWPTPLRLNLSQDEGGLFPCPQPLSALFISPKAPAMQQRHVWQDPHLTDSGLIGHGAETPTCSMKHPPSPPLSLPAPEGRQSGWKIDSLEHLGPPGFFSRPAVDADKGSAVGFSLFVLNRRFVLSPFSVENLFVWKFSAVSRQRLLSSFSNLI